MENIFKRSFIKLKFSMLIKNRLKILFIYFLGTIGIILGNLIKLIRGNKKNNRKYYNKIIINRSDRLGDAIISRPFIKLLIKFLKEENYSDNFLILASSYNSFILKNLEDNNTKLEEIKKNIDYEMNILQQVIKSLKIFIKNILLFFSKIFNKSFYTNKNNLFIDLVGDPYLLNIYKDNYIIIGPNLFLNSILLDYQSNLSYVYHKNKKNLIEQYIDIIEGYFNFQGKFREYVYKNINYFIPVEDLTKKKNILVFVGTKKYRNISINKWKEIINFLSKKYYNKKIIVIDDNQNLLYHILKQEKFNDNVEIKNNTFNLSEFVNFAKGFEVIIGIDGGGMNMIRNLTNSITIYTIGNEKVWRQFIGKSIYEKKYIGNNWFMEVSYVNGKQIVNIYKNGFFLPSYDIELEKEYFNDLPLNFLEFYIPKNNKN